MARSGSQGSALVDILFGEDGQVVDNLFEEGNSGSVVILGSLPEMELCNLVRALAALQDTADLASDLDKLLENRAAGKAEALVVPLEAFQAAYQDTLVAFPGTSLDTSLDTCRASFLASCRGTFPSYFPGP